MTSPLPGRASANHDYQERPSTSFSAIGRRPLEHSNFTTTAEFEAYSKNPQDRNDRPVNLTSRIGTIRKIRAKATFESPLPSITVAPVIEDCARTRLPPKLISTPTDRDNIRKDLELDTSTDETGPEKPLTLELVYSIRQNKFYHIPRSILLPRECKDDNAIRKGNKRAEHPVFFEVKENDPPVLCDGRVAVLQIPRWKRSVKFYWRLSNGEVLCRRVVLPVQIWYV
jgi:hypothetical protein